MCKKTKIYEKYSIKNPKKKPTFFKLVNLDTTPTSKYCEYMCKLWLKKTIWDRYTVSQIKNLVKNFESHINYLNNKDIYSKDYSSFYKATNIIDDAIYEKNCKEFDRHKNVKVLFEDDNHLVVKILTVKAAQKYGMNTKWCISGKDLYGDYSRYSEFNKIYFIIRKKQKNTVYDKIAVLLPKKLNNKNIQLFTAIDEQVKLKKLLLKSDWEENNIRYFYDLILKDGRRINKKLVK